MNPNDAPISKITAPKLPKIILRPRLFKYLDETAPYAVTWLSAMAGSGKTTYALSYLTHHRQAHVWYRLDSGDSDPAFFFQNLSRAANGHLCTGKRALPLFTPENTPGGEAFAHFYFETLSEVLPKPIWLVFDDYQELDPHSPVHTLLAKGFDAIQPQIRALVISRSDPPPEMAASLAKRRLHVMHADEMRFNRKETKQFISVLSGKAMDDRTLNAVHGCTQGWAAGIVLLSGNLRQEALNGFEPSSALPTDLFNYFAVELFNRQTDDIQSFLLKTAHLPQMTVKATAMLTGRTNADRILLQLKRRHLFIERINAPEPVYRYHMLWRRFLIDQNPSRFSGAEVRHMRQAAAKILTDQGHLEDAAQLLVQADDQRALETLILEHAGELIRQGCHSTLADWLNRLPAAKVESSPWLCYWSGICLLFAKPVEAQRKLHTAFLLFKKTQESDGLLLSWSGLVDSIVYEWHFFTRLDRLLRWFDRHFSGQANPCRGTFVDARVTVSLAVAMMIRRPHDPRLFKTVDKSIQLARKSGETDLILRASVWTITCFAWLGDFDRAAVTLGEFRKVAEDHADRLPSLTLQWQWLDLSIRAATMDRIETASQEIQEALTSADRSGLFFTAQTLVFLQAYVAMTVGDQFQARKSILKLESLLDESHYHGHTVYHHFAGWYQLLWGEPRKALAYARKATEVSARTGYVLVTLVCRIQLAFCLFENNQKKQARREISRVWIWSRKTDSAIYQFMVLLVKGYFAGREHSPWALRYLRDGLTIGRRHRYLNMIWWGLPRLWDWVAAAAIQNNIETGYVKKLILRHRIPAPEEVPDSDRWPWPFVVRTLGGFRIEKEGQAMVFSGKPPKKPLALFQHIIAHAPGSDAVETVIDDLWPDADSDSGSSALSTTLNRLRRLLGDPASIGLNEGHLSLTISRWWLDHLAFERYCAAAARCHQAKELPAALTHYQKALSLYRGEFLAGEKHEQNWLTARRATLKETFIRMLTDYGRCLEVLDDHNRAVSIYQQGLAVDKYEEIFYQRLIYCCHHLGHFAKAANYYKRCCRILEGDLGVPPSQETQKLYRKMLRAAQESADSV